MKWLVTGGCGFIGTNATQRLVEGGDEVVVIDNLSRPLVHRNLRYLRDVFGVECHVADIRNAAGLEHIVHAHNDTDAVLHLAGQVSLLASIKDPRLDFEVNALGTLNVLEAVRTTAPDATVIYSSTNKVYGDLADLTLEETDTRFVLADHPEGVDESQPLDFHGGYGCSKGAADQYVLDYHRTYGVRTVVLRQSSIYGGLQYATFDQGWLAFFVKMGIRSEPFQINGTGKQVRDALHVDDLTGVFRSAVRSIDQTVGQAFNIGGGPTNALSLLELFAILRNRFGLSIEFDRGPERPGDQKVFISDNARALDGMGWVPTINIDQGLDRLVEWTRATFVTG